MHNEDFLTKLVWVLISLAVLLAGVRLTRRSPLPYPAAMALGGLIVSLIPGTPAVRLTPDIVLYGVLPPLLYSAAWNTSWPEFRRNIRAVSFLAFGLVFLTIFAVGFGVKIIFTDMPWSVALMLGAILSPPDAIAATVVCRRAKVSARLLAILEGESLVNDAGALVAFRLALAATVAGTFTIGDAAFGLVLAAGGGTAIGIAIGWLATHVHRGIAQDPFVTLGVSLLVPYTAFMTAELAHASGVLAVVAAGILVSRKSPALFEPESRLVAVAVWGTLTLFLNALAFSLVGLQASIIGSESSTLLDSRLVLATFGAGIAVVGIRFLFVMLTARMATGTGFFERNEGMTFKHHLVVAWTGMRGVVSLAAVLSLPLTLPGGAPFPYRQELVAITFALVLFTLVVESLTLPWLIRRLGLAAGTEEEEARALVAREVCSVSRCTPPPSGSPPSSLTSTLTETEVLASRARLNQLREDGKIGEEIFRQYEYFLDLRELSLRHRLLEIG
jgi:monovalent cation/hydrogen antiporter